HCVRPGQNVSRGRREPEIAIQSAAFMIKNSDTSAPAPPALPSRSSLGKYVEHWITPDAEFRYAQTRDRKRYRHYDHEQALVGRWLRLCPPGATVLDLSCGAGRFNELVATCGHRLIRADLSLPMVAHARRLGPNDL